VRGAFGGAHARLQCNARLSQKVLGRFPACESRSVSSSVVELKVMGQFSTATASHSALKLSGPKSPGDGRGPSSYEALAQASVVSPEVRRR
jgi:hypothetical protein